MKRREAGRERERGERRAKGKYSHTHMGRP